MVDPLPALMVKDSAAIVEPNVVVTDVGLDMLLDRTIFGLPADTR